MKTMDNGFMACWRKISYTLEINGSSTNDEFLIELVNKLLDSYDFPLPLAKHTLKKEYPDQAKKFLMQYWGDWSIKKFSSLRGHPASIGIPHEFRGESWLLVVRKSDWWNVDVVVDYFTEYERLNTGKIYAPSVKESWKNKDIRMKILEKFVKSRKWTVEELRDCIYRSSKEVSTFRPSRCVGFLTKIYNCSIPAMLSGKKWLDISAGWGDRLFTACGLGMSYMGFDPNTNLIPGHKEMINRCGDQNLQQVFPYPFESEMVEKLLKLEINERGLFDFCLTSPPFFDIESYNGQNQSTDNYPQFDTWLVDFLFVSLDRAWNCLKDDGYLAINLANISGRDMVSPMVYFVNSLLGGSSWVGLLTFSGRSTQDSPGTLYVWQKKSKDTNYDKNEKDVNSWQSKILADEYPGLHEKWITRSH